MKREFLLTNVLCIFLLVSSCNEKQKTHSKKALQLTDFEFYISGSDETGLIQFPSSIENSTIKEIRVINEPKGSYEIFQLNLNERIKASYVIYTAPNKEVKEDKINFKLIATNGTVTKVTAHLSPIRNGQCHESNSPASYNWLIENHFLTVQKGEPFNIQLDGFDTSAPASASLLPNCDAIQDYGIRTITLVPLDTKPLFEIPRSFEASKIDSGSQGIGYWNRKGDSALFISGRVPADSQSGEYRFIYSVFAHKLKDGFFLPNFKAYPESNQEWKEQLTAHRYGIISLSVID